MMAAITATDAGGDPPQEPIPAAQYIRMSTEHQQYSTENQADMIREYAARRGYQVVETYADAGKSGLRIEGRDSLRRLLNDVQSGKANFRTILAYDISRWGRFQDADESAYYEYICRRAGISVEYCAEQFENDGSPTATIIKSVKRAMAGEYSRELSTKVFKGQCRLIELGYRQGGPAGYGLRRMLISQAGEAKGVLKRGEHKSLQTDRVILVPGPTEEQEQVRRMYQMFTAEGLCESEIAQSLNAQGIVNADLGRAWTAQMVHQVLSNEKYIGNNVYNRVSFKLKKKRVCNAPEIWVRREAAFKPIVDPAVFYTARGIIVERSRRYSDEELLGRLKDLLAKHGELSAGLIDETDGMPGTSQYQSRFGSLLRAYQLVGFSPDRDYRYVQMNRHIRSLRSPYEDDVIQALRGLGAQVERVAGSGELMINCEYTARIIFTRCRQTPTGTLRWLINADDGPPVDITVVVRMDATNEVIQDLYLLPKIDVRPASLRIGESNGAAIDTYRYDSIHFFISLAARAKVEVAA